MPGTPVHDRTVAHKAAVLDWVTGLAADAGAPDPRGLARSLTLLLDGGLASGALDADPEAAARAAQSARVLVDARWFTRGIGPHEPPAAAARHRRRACPQLDPADAAG